jgi:hypothetical protein
MCIAESPTFGRLPVKPSIESRTALKREATGHKTRRVRRGESRVGNREIPFSIFFFSAIQSASDRHSLEIENEDEHGDN